MDTRCGVDDDPVRARYEFWKRLTVGAFLALLATLLASALLETTPHKDIAVCTYGIMGIATVLCAIRAIDSKHSVDDSSVPLRSSRLVS